MFLKLRITLVSRLFAPTAFVHVKDLGVPPTHGPLFYTHFAPNLAELLVGGSGYQH